MTDLILKGPLNLTGTLKLAANDGKVRVKINELEQPEVLVMTGESQGKGIPVIQPPPPAGPIDPGVGVKITNSINSKVTVKDLSIVTLGITAQGNNRTWPGMILPSKENTTVKINQIPINVVGDQAVTLPNGGTVNFNVSGQT